MRREKKKAAYSCTYFHDQQRDHSHPPKYTCQVRDQTTIKRKHTEVSIPIKMIKSGSVILAERHTHTHPQQISFIHSLAYKLQTAGLVISSWFLKF